ncbi:TIGR01212 family radical SAM protein [Pelagicoccus albus]|uniref:TIGR01212 family radical SAM protein n=1 Tax=Pelagicoccus albus TaxID=415222 RepID=UPI0030DCF8B8
MPSPFHPKRYHYYGRFLREKFGCKVFKVVVDAGFTCPNRDGQKGWGGCAYCNVDSFTPKGNGGRSASVAEQVLTGIERARKNYGAEKFMVYFQPNTNTYAEVGELERIYREAVSVAPDDILGLTIGTRPDCIDREKLEMLKRAFPDLYVTIEYGLESARDDILASINRGATHAEFVSAVELTAAYGFDVCAHTIFGLPGETEENWMALAEELNRLPIRFVKLHHLHVVKGSILAKRYRDNPFPLFSLESYAEFLCRFLPALRADMVVQRLFGVADEDDLIAPDWGLRKSEIQREIERSLDSRQVVQGSSFPKSGL